jgi:hypothetical protein
MNEVELSCAIILDDDLENPIEYCISVILKEARKEQRLVKQLLYVMLSAYTNNPLNLAINSPTGEGKNWVLEKVAEMFPLIDIEFLSGNSSFPIITSSLTCD